MKLPIQKMEHKREQLGTSPAEEMWPTVRNFMERFFPGDIVKPWLGWERNPYQEVGSWMPRVDVSEAENEFEVTADLPGIKPEDIKVEVAGQSLIVKGKREEKKEKEEGEKGKTWHRLERYWGSFYREFELPQSADMEKIEATAQDGMLRIKVQKKPEAQSRTIEVKKEGQGGGKKGQMQEGMQQPE
jgi:HSP20 family protein